MMGGNVLELGYGWCEHRARDIAKRHPGAEYVLGIPMGGLPVAMMVGLRPLLPNECWSPAMLRKNYGETLLVVDDIVDSGRTLAPYVAAGLRTDALICRTEEQSRTIAPSAMGVDRSKWVKFPWEKDSSPTDAVVRLLEWVGEDPHREGLLETPARVTKAFREMTCGYADDPAEILSKQFDERSDQFVILRNVEFASLCEHHLLPFVGKADVGYLPGEKVVGLSKLARLVRCYAKRLQVQERMTHQIASALMEHCGARAAGVVIKAQHQCMACRGVEQNGADMVTSAMLGMLRDNAMARQEFMNLLTI